MKLINIIFIVLWLLIVFWFIYVLVQDEKKKNG